VIRKTGGFEQFRQQVGPETFDAYMASHVYLDKGSLFCTPRRRLFFLFLAPIFLIGLQAVAFVWLPFWLVYLFFVVRYFPRIQTPQESQ
jgi:hypothetical protein